MSVPLLTPTPPSGGAAGRGRFLTGVLRRNASASIGFVVLVGIVTAAIAAPWLAPTELGERVGDGFEAPSPQHPLGLDDAGEDVITLLLYGARTTLLVGFGATLLAVGIGALVGVLAGYLGGRIEGLLMRLTDFFLVVPEVPLMMIIAAAWGTGLTKLIAVIGLILWTWTARVVRSQASSLRARVFVRRSRAMGAGHWYVVTRHVLPQLAPLLVVSGVLAFAVAVFDETALSFLGLGAPDRPSLGRMIALASEAGAVSNNAWWAILYPGLVVTLIILSLTMMGTALEDALNPRLRVSHLARQHFRVLPVARTVTTRTRR